MAIGSAVQRGGFVYLYNERGIQVTIIPAGGRDGLLGYTSSSVSIRRDMFVYLYDERGKLASIIPSP